MLLSKVYSQFCTHDFTVCLCACVRVCVHVLNKIWLKDAILLPQLLSLLCLKYHCIGIGHSGIGVHHFTVDKFSGRMTEYLKSPSNTVFTDDMKTMIFITETEEDLALCTEMMKRYGNIIMYYHVCIASESI